MINEEVLEVHKCECRAINRDYLELAMKIAGILCKTSKFYNLSEGVVGI